MPFSDQQFIELFATYNTSVFPAQIVLLVAGLLAVRLSSNGDAGSSRATAAILSGLWLWIGYVYHWVYFVRINELAVAFGALSVVQAAVIFYAGVIRNDLSFDRQSGLRHSIGNLLLVYALLIYPLIGIAMGRSYPYTPTFGLPCPTTIFTFGLLVRSGTHTPFYVLALMIVWSVIGSSAPVLFGIYEDYGLPVAGVVAVAFAVVQRLQEVRLQTRFTLKEN